MQEEFVPVKKILSIINSCETEAQLKNCLNMIENYVEQTKEKGLTNSDVLKLRLIKEYKQKKFQISMLKLFIKKHQKEFDYIYSKKSSKIIA